MPTDNKSSVGETLVIKNVDMNLLLKQREGLTRLIMSGLLSVQIQDILEGVLNMLETAVDDYSNRKGQEVL